MKQELKANKRKTGPHSIVQKLRANGQVPGTVYGLKKDPTPIDVPHTPLLKIAADSNPNNILVLNFGDSQEEVLIRELVWHKVKTSTITHVDFLRVNDQEPVTVKVPVITKGVPIGVKTQGGQFSMMKKWIKVTCKAKDIPAAFEQDVSDMEAGTVFYTREIQFPNGKIVTPEKTALYGISKGRAKAEDKK